MQKVDPCEPTEIINKGHKIFIVSVGKSWSNSPYIAMNQIKTLSAV